MIKELIAEQIEELASEIVDFLIKYRLLVDIVICFNNSVYKTEDVYNDRKYLVRENNVKSDKYVKNHNPEHILSISYDSRLYEVLHYGVYEIDDEVVKTFHECDEFVGNLQEEFYNIFKKYGLDYYYCGNGEITCYYMGNKLNDFLLKNTKI